LEVSELKLAQRQKEDESLNHNLAQDTGESVAGEVDIFKKPK